MARKKSKAKSGSRKGSRRVSGIVGKDTAMEIVGTVLGGIAAKIVQRQATNMNPKIVAIGTGLLGLFGTKQRSPLFRGAGYAMLSQGASSLATNVGLISGIEESLSGFAGMGGDDDGLGAYEYELNGMPNNFALSGASGLGDLGAVMNGMNNNQIIAGAEDGGFNMNPGTLG